MWRLWLEVGLHGLAAVGAKQYQPGSKKVYSEANRV